MRPLALLLCLTAAPAFAQTGSITLSGVTKPVTVSNSYRWLDSQKRDLTGMRLENFGNALPCFGRNPVRIDRGHKDVVVRNGVFRLCGPTTGSNLPVAVEVVNGSNVLIENVQAYGFRMVPVNGTYNNGDCFSGERASRNVTLRNTLASNCSDGGYDFKTIGLRLENTVAEDVGKGYRIWGQMTASTITCRRWRDGCVQTNAGVAGFPVTASVDHLILEPDLTKTATNFGFSKGSTVNIATCSGALSPGKVIFWQSGASATNANITLCGVRVTNQTDAQLRAQITAQIVKDTAARAAAQPDLTGVCAFAAPLDDRNNDGIIDLGAANRAKCQGTRRVKLLGQNRADQYVYGKAP